GDTSLRRGPWLVRLAAHRQGSGRAIRHRRKLDVYEPRPIQHSAAMAARLHGAKTQRPNHLPFVDNGSKCWRAGCSSGNNGPSRFFRHGSWLPYVNGGYGFLVNSFVLSLGAFLLSIQYAFPYFFGIQVYKGAPSDTLVLIVIWLWCGFQLLRQTKEAPTDTEA